MSFILDALRKSDARRQQGDTPGLNTPEPTTPPRRRRRMLPAVLAGLLLCALAAGGIYFAQPEWLPQRLASTGQDDEGGALRTEPSAGADAAEETGEDSASQDAGQAPDPVGSTPTPPRADNGEQREVASADEPATGAAGDEKNKPEERGGNRRSLMPAPADRSVSRPAPQRESRPVASDEGTAELERRMARAEERRAEARERAAAASEAEGEGAGEASDQSAEPVEPVEPKPLNTGVDEYLRAWELPLSVRRNMPDLALTIHVYSPQEEKRFVLINGERYGAGDQIGEARIVSIERDGAVIDFRSHRFLLEPR